MTYQELDFIFPFIVFVYGAVMVLVFSHPNFLELAEKRLPAPVWQQFQSKRILGLVCFIVGGLWSLQNLWTH